MKNPFKYWWLVLIKGIIFIFLAGVAFFEPVSALIALAIYIGVSLLVSGLIVTISALINRKTDEYFGWHLTVGVVDIIFALILLTNPAITAAVFPIIVGFWTIVYSIMLFANSFKIRKEGEKNWWAETFGGILAAVIGYLIMSNPVIGALTITFWIGLGFLIFGILNIFVAIRLHKV